jgi:hypothetical protein
MTEDPLLTILTLIAIFVLAGVTSWIVVKALRWTIESPRPRIVYRNKKSNTCRFCKENIKLKNAKFGYTKRSVNIYGDRN